MKRILTTLIYIMALSTTSIIADQKNLMNLLKTIAVAAHDIEQAVDVINTVANNSDVDLAANDAIQAVEIINTIAHSSQVDLAANDTIQAVEIINALKKQSRVHKDMDNDMPVVSEDAVEPAQSILQELNEKIHIALSLIMNYIHSFVGTPENVTISEAEVRAILRHRNNEQPISSRKERIIAHIAKIVSNIFNIIRDPHNKHNVGDNVGAMVQEIITITVNAIKNKEDKKMVRAQLNEMNHDIDEYVAMIMIMGKK